MRRLLLLVGCALLAGCPPTDGDLDMDPTLDGLPPDAAPADMDSADMDPTPDQGGDMDPDPDMGACDPPGDLGPPNPVPPEGYAGCYRDRFQVEVQASAGADLPPGFALALEADLNADLLTPDLDQNWFSTAAMPVTAAVVPVVNAERFLQVEFRDDNGARAEVDAEWQCNVIDRIGTQVTANLPNPGARATINVGRACPVVALGLIDEPSLEMRSWHLESIGLGGLQAGEHPVIPRGPAPNAVAGADIVLIDSGVDPALLDALGISEVAIDAEIGAEERLSGHGSAMALLMRQVAPDARLHSIRVLGEAGYGSIADLARALDAAATLGDGGACAGETVPAGACQACPEPELDLDEDGVCANVDNCPEVANADQADGDGDGIGDACDDYGCVPTGVDDCDGLDNDCDGQVDEDPAHVCPQERGQCPRAPVCQDGAPVCVQAIGEVLEQCDGMQQACGDVIDQGTPSTLCAVEGDWCNAGRTVCTLEGTVCEPDRELACGREGACRPDDLGQPCAVRGLGNCAGGVTVCRLGEVTCEPAWRPTNLDFCGDGDADCDGTVDEDASSGPCPTGLAGACAVGEWACTPEGVVCAPSGGDEICDGIDNDCDGTADEGLDCETCCALEGGLQTVALAACPEAQRRDREACEVVCCAGGERLAAGDCEAPAEPGECDVCCVEGQATPIAGGGAPMVVNLSLGWPPELSRPRTLTGDGGACEVIEDPVGESVRWTLEQLANRDDDGISTAVFAASGNRPGRPRGPSTGGEDTNILGRIYRRIFRVVTPTPADSCNGRFPVPSAPYWFMPGGFGRQLVCGTSPMSPGRQLAFGVGAITDTDLPTAQSIFGAEGPLVGPGQHVYVDHPELPRRTEYMCGAAKPEPETLEGPHPFTGTSVPTALASAAAALAQATRASANEPPLSRRALQRLLYFTGRPVDPRLMNTPRVADFGGLPVHRLDVCRMQFALTDPGCAMLRTCVEGAGGADPLAPSCSAQMACLAAADGPMGPCAERDRAPVPVNPDYDDTNTCESANLCASAWIDAETSCGEQACPFEQAPDRYSMGTLSGTPSTPGCPDCFLNAIKARLEVVVSQPLNVISATLYYDEAPFNTGVKYQVLPDGDWFPGDTFDVTSLVGFAGQACPSFAKLDLVIKDNKTGQYISDTSPIRVECF